MRLWTRALIRARIPLRFSEGFNPHPKLSLPLPRPVGVASSDELLVIDLTEPVAPDAAAARLAAQLPAGLTLHGVVPLDERSSPQPRIAVYRAPYDNVPADDVAQRVRKLLEQPRIAMERRRADGTPVKTVDLRPYIASIAVTPDAVVMQLRIDAGGTARADEVLRALDLEDAAPSHRIRRQSVEWHPPIPADALTSSVSNEPERTPRGSDDEEEDNDAEAS